MEPNRTEQSRRRLIEGVQKFQREIYPQREFAYRQSAQGQRPHALFITCADSRIDPEMITQSGPGEIFVSRNIGNIVPPFGGQISGSVAAIVEYAVAGLNVSHVVICGHSDCGAMIGLLNPRKVMQLQNVTGWLRNADPALAAVRGREAGQHERSELEALTEENVMQQLRNLSSHPTVAERLAQGTLALSGWIYEIASGDVRIYDPQARAFLPVPRTGVASSAGPR